MSWGLEQQLMQSLRPKQQKKVFLKSYIFLVIKYFGLYHHIPKAKGTEFKKLLWTFAVILQNTTKSYDWEMTPKVCSTIGKSMCHTNFPQV